MSDQRKQLAHRAKVKEWFDQHPNYQCEYQAKQKQLRAELGVAKNGTIPVKSQRKITYTISATKPLTKDERYVRQIHNRASTAQACDENERE